MSVKNELQKLLSSDERGTINEVSFGALGGIQKGLTAAAKGTIAGLSAVKKATGKAIQKTLGYIGSENFKLKEGLKDIKDIDTKLTQLKVNDPEFFAILKSMAGTMVTFEKAGPGVYEALMPIFSKHIRRLIEYYISLLEDPADERQEANYYAALTDILSWLQVFKDSKEISYEYNHLSDAITRYNDTKEKEKLTKSGVKSAAEKAKAKEEEKRRKKMIEDRIISVDVLNAQPLDTLKDDYKYIEDLIKKERSARTPEEKEALKNDKEFQKALAFAKKYALTFKRVIQDREKQETPV